MSSRYPFLLLALVFLATYTTEVAHAQINFLDVVASKDNTLYADAAGAKSNAKGQHLFAGNTASGAQRRGILAFDVAGVVPSGAVIDSVRLTLYMSRTLSIADTPVYLHRVSADWGEGTSVAGGEEGAGGPSQPGDATWVHRFWFDQMWQNAGGDFQSPADDTLDVGEPNFYTWGSTPQMIAAVQQWLDDPSTNFGWLLRGNESAEGTAKRFASRENTDESRRPRLRVYYTVATSTEADAVPGLLRLAENYPNPFRQTTTIGYELARPQPVTLRIYDVRGRQIATLVDGMQGAGPHEATFHADALPAGLYLYRLATGGAHLHRAMLLTR